MLIALLAIFLQAFAVQTHVHAYGLSSLAGYERSTGESASPDDNDVRLSTPGEHNVCVMCQALTSGRSALPTVSDLVAPRQDLAEQTVLALAEAPQRRSHAWRSRAPPIVL